MKKVINEYSLALIFFVSLLSLFGILSSISLSVIYPNLYIRQLISIAIGYALMFVFAFLNHKVLRRFAKISYIIILILLIYLLARHGVQRFVDLGPFAIQPSQYAFIVFSLLIANIFSKKIKDEELPKVFLIALFLLIVLSFLVIFEPDMGSGAQILLSGFVTLIVIGMPSIQIAITTILGILGVFALIPLNSEWARRVEAFVNPKAHASDEALQTLQSLRAFARGGITGVGFLKGMFKYPGVLPVSLSDFILPVIGEEFGGVFIIILVVMYVGILFVGFKIAREAKSTFSRILAVGLTVGICMWAVINIAVSLGLMPTTGVPLPFVSFGGNNMIANFVSIGILINISRKEVEE